MTARKQILQERLPSPQLGSTTNRTIHKYTTLNHFSHASEPTDAVAFSGLGCLFMDSATHTEVGKVGLFWVAYRLILHWPIPNEDALSPKARGKARFRHTENWRLTNWLLFYAFALWHYVHEIHSQISLFSRHNSPTLYILLMKALNWTFCKLELI